jgi:sugar-specific transcriptional regulator TrmB
MNTSSREITPTIRALEILGLSENEAILYTLMLNHPQCTVQELETRAPFPRTMLYYVLKQLMGRELVSALKEKWRTVYIAETPDRLHEVLSKKEEAFAQNRATIRDLIPKLKRQYQLAGKRPSVRMLEGIDAYKKILEDSIVTKPKEILCYEVLLEQKAALEVRRAHEARRISHKILKKILFFEDMHATKFIKQRPYDDFTQFRSIKGGSVESFATDVALYEGKLLYTSYYDTHEPTAILVEDEALFAMQKNLFNTLWKQAKDRTLAYIEKV